MLCRKVELATSTAPSGDCDVGVSGRGLPSRVIAIEDTDVNRVRLIVKGSSGTFMTSSLAGSGSSGSLDAVRSTAMCVRSWPMPSPTGFEPSASFQMSAGLSEWSRLSLV